MKYIRIYNLQSFRQGKRKPLGNNHEALWWSVAEWTTYRLILMK